MQMVQTIGSDDYIFSYLGGKSGRCKFLVNRRGSKYEDIVPVNTANQPPLAKVTLVKKAYHQWAQTLRSNFPEADLSVYCLHTAVVHLTELSKKHYSCQ